MRPEPTSPSASRPPADRFIDDASGDPRFCSIGDGGRGRPVVHVYQGDRNQARIGAGVTFGEDVAIFVGGNHRIDWVTTFGLREVLQVDGAFEGNPWSKGDVVIGDGAHIGRGTKIMSGVNIGPGAVVRPFSIVVGDVEACTVVGGCPARAVAGEAGVVVGPIPVGGSGRGGRTELVEQVWATMAPKVRSVRDVLRRLLRRALQSRVESQPTVAPNLSMGRATYFAPIVYGRAGRVTIGSYSSIPYDGEMAMDGLLPATAGVAAERRHGGLRAGPPAAEEARDITIGNDVWIGRGAKVLGGVTIGDGAVVAAYSVVTDDVRPYAIAAGNPAREVARRFDDVTVDALLEIQWWSWSEETVRARAPELCSADVQAFVRRYGPGRGDPDGVQTGPRG